MKNIILGGGISGLLALNIIPNSMLIEATDKLASDILDNTFPKYIHDTKEIEPFAEGMIRIDFDIFILYDGYFVNFFNDNPMKWRIEALKAYCFKKYGNCNVGTLQDKMNGYVSGKHSRQFIGCKEELVRRLIKESLYIELNCPVKSIDIEKKVLKTDKQLFFYKNLISTLPMNVFSGLSGLKFGIKYITLSVIKIEYKSDFGICKDFIYVVDGNYHFHRINNNRDNHEMIFEMDIGHEKDIASCLKYMKDYNIEAGKVKYYQFKYPVAMQTIWRDSVYFLGRAAEGNYSLKTEDVIRHAGQIREDIRNSEKNK